MFDDSVGTADQIATLRDRFAEYEGIQQMLTLLEMVAGTDATARSIIRYLEKERSEDSLPTLERLCAATARVYLEKPMHELLPRLAALAQLLGA